MDKIVSINAIDAGDCLCTQAFIDKTKNTFILEPVTLALNGTHLNDEQYGEDCGYAGCGSGGCSNCSSCSSSDAS